MYGVLLSVFFVVFELESVLYSTGVAESAHHNISFLLVNAFTSSLETRFLRHGKDRDTNPKSCQICKSSKTDGTKVKKLRTQYYLDRVAILEFL